MTKEESKTILYEYNKWRRGESPYDGDNPDNYRGCPYTPKDIGEAIDVAAQCLDDVIHFRVTIVPKCLECGSRAIEGHIVLTEPAECTWKFGCGHETTIQL